MEYGFVCNVPGLLFVVYAVTWLPGELLRKRALRSCGIAGEYLVYQRFGLHHALVHRAKKARVLAAGVGAAIGFYGGFFAPETGGFLISLFVRLFGFDFLQAFAVSKVVNVACNLTALLWLGDGGNVLWNWDWPAVFNVAARV